MATIGVRWLGHSTVLLELPALALLTDPFFRDRLGPLRRHGPLPDPAALPPIDLVLLSHAHPDHFDGPSLRAVAGDPLVIAPRGMAASIWRARPGARVTELRIGEGHVQAGWTITGVRARHWRWPFAPMARCLGYLVEGPVGVWFAGDTGRFGGMRELAGRVDLALLPIGRWGPQPTPGHLTPETAARVAGVVQPRVVVPIHWGTLYPAGLDRLVAGPLREPADRFGRAMARHAPDVEVRSLAPGDRATLELPERGKSPLSGEASLSGDPRARSTAR